MCNNGITKKLEIYDQTDLFRAIRSAERLELQYKIETAYKYSTNLLGGKDRSDFWRFIIYQESDSDAG